MIQTAQKEKVHFLDPYLGNPTNPLRVHLIGAGGTGSAMLTALARLQVTLLALGHPGCRVILWDDDLVTASNVGRQLFSPAELGLPKASALISRVNRFMGLDWTAHIQRFPNIEQLRDWRDVAGSIYITCVDSVKTRFDLAEMLEAFPKAALDRDRPRYWLDMGNARDFGQAILGTVGKIEQPEVSNYMTTHQLPTVIEEYGDLLLASEQKDDTPSCSVADALRKQSLNINYTLAVMGCDLLSELFFQGMTRERGFFLNLKNKTCQPLKV